MSSQSRVSPARMGTFSKFIARDITNDIKTYDQSKSLHKKMPRTTKCYTKQNTFQEIDKANQPYLEFYLYLHKLKKCILSDKAKPMVTWVLPLLI